MYLNPRRKETKKGRRREGSKKGRKAGREEKKVWHLKLRHLVSSFAGIH